MALAALVWLDHETWRLLWQGPPWKQLYVVAQVVLWLTACVFLLWAAARRGSASPAAKQQSEASH
jgi:hypothetical protein